MAQSGLDALAGPPVIFDLSVPANCAVPVAKLFSGRPVVIQAVFAVAFCVAVAALSHYVIEKPFLSLKDRFGQRKNAAQAIQKNSPSSAVHGGITPDSGR